MSSIESKAINDNVNNFENLQNVLYQNELITCKIEPPDTHEGFDGAIQDGQLKGDVGQTTKHNENDGEYPPKAGKKTKDKVKKKKKSTHIGGSALYKVKKAKKPTKKKNVKLKSDVKSGEVLNEISGEMEGIVLPQTNIKTGQWRFYTLRSLNSFR